MKASEVITKARYTLSDSDKSRWSDDRLLSLLNDALLDLALTTRVFSDVGYVKLVKGLPVYDVALDAIKLDRFEHLSKPLSMLSFSEMDTKKGSQWQDKSGDKPEAIVYDLKKSAQFRVYPVPTLGADSRPTGNSDYGIITGLGYSDITIRIQGDFGDIAEPNQAEYLKLYYTRTPTKVTSVSDELDSVVSQVMVSCLSHYVSGNALRDNMDAQNRQVGLEELAMYRSSKEDLIMEKELGNVARIRQTPYNPMGF